MARYLITLSLILALAGYAARAQSEKKAEPDTSEQARALIERAIKTMGGPAYLSIKSERARGYLTPYRDTSPDSKEHQDRQPDKLATQSFVDLILLPDKERVEFKGQEIGRA